MTRFRSPILSSRIAGSASTAHKRRRPNHASRMCKLNATQRPASTRRALLWPDRSSRPDHAALSGAPRKFRHEARRYDRVNRCGAVVSQCSERTSTNLWQANVFRALSCGFEVASWIRVSEPLASHGERRAEGRVDRRRISRSGRRTSDPHVNWRRLTWLFAVYVLAKPLAAKLDQANLKIHYVPSDMFKKMPEYEKEFREIFWKK